MEVNPERINTIYTESSKLRNYVNLFKENLKLLQEVSLNTAINASKENSAILADIYKMIANQIRKNTLDMVGVLDKFNNEINELVKYSLAGLKKNSYNTKISLGLTLIDIDPHHNKEIIQNAISNNNRAFEKILKNLSIEIENIKKLHIQLIDLNKKIWLTTTNLKVENNIKEINKGFFDSIAEILDQKNDFMTKKLEELGRDIMLLDRMIKIDI